MTPTSSFGRPGKIVRTFVAGTLAFLAATALALAGVVDVQTYVPAAGAPTGYVSYLRVINTGNAATPISVARIDAATGTVSSGGQLTSSLLAGAAITFTADQVEAALGFSPPAADRSRLRVTASTSIEAQSFLLQPGGVFNEVSAMQSGESITVPTYIPAAAAPTGYQSYLRVINTGGTASAVTIARVDPASGTVGAAVTLVGSLPAGAAMTFTASQIESTLGISPAAAERPTMIVTATGTTLNAQSFLTQPGGAFTNASSSQSGTTVDVRNYVPAAVSGFTTYLRIVNKAATATAVTATLLDDASGAAGASATLIASLPGYASMTLPSSQVESALGISIPAASRPRMRISSATNDLTVQSFMLQPGGAFNEFSGVLSGTSVVVRTYIPAADAVNGYSTYLRIINTGTTATPVAVALVDTAGTVGNSATLIASLPAGAARSFTPSQVEAILGTSVSAGNRPRLLVSGNGSNVLEVQSYLTQPGGIFTEVSGAHITTASATYSAVAMAGEMVDYTVDTNTLTYSYVIITSQYGLTGKSGSGTLSANGDGTYSLSGIPRATVALLPGGVLLGAIREVFNGVLTTVPVMGIRNPISIAQAVGTYNYVDRGCVSGTCGVGEGTIRVNPGNTWDFCRSGNITAGTSSCGALVSGTITDVGNGRWQLVQNGVVLGTGIAFNSGGLNVFVVDLTDSRPNGNGIGLLFGSQQETMTASGVSGTWVYGSSTGNWGTFSTDGSTITALTLNGAPTSGSKGLTLNNPWDGFGYPSTSGSAILSSNGVYAFVVPTTTYYGEIGLKIR